VTTLADNHLAPSDFRPPSIPPVNLVTDPSPNFSAPRVSTPLLRSSELLPSAILGSASVSGLPPSKSAVSTALSSPPTVSVLPVPAHFGSLCAPVLYCSCCNSTAPTSNSAVFAYLETPDLCAAVPIFGPTAVPNTAAVSGLIVSFPPMHLCHDFFWPSFAHLLQSFLPPVYNSRIPPSLCSPVPHPFAML
jgi:hypothetical protein